MMWKVLLIGLLFGSVTSQTYGDQQQTDQEPDQEQENEGALAGGNGVEGPLDPSIPEPPSQIPETSFTCEGRQYDPGMYADEETGCRVYHLCFRGKKEDFICGTGTIFNQEILSCDYPDNVDCAASSQFYGANEELGKGSPEPGPGDQGRAKPTGNNRPSSQQPQADFGGTQGSQGPADDNEDDYQAPAAAVPTRPASKPRVPAARPPTAPQQPRQRPASRPSTPRSKASPAAPRQPTYRPQAPSGGGSAPAPRRPSKTRPVNRERPAAQEQSLDYEPSTVVQRRVPAQIQRRNLAPQRRWTMMSEA